MKIIGRLYGETPRYYDFDDNHNWPYYDEVDKKEWEVDNEDVDYGERWLIENHPEYYMGGNIYNNKGDFICLAVPGLEYGEGNFETVEKRVEYIKERMYS